MSRFNTSQSAAAAVKKEKQETKFYLLSFLLPNGFIQVKGTAVIPK